MTTVNQKSTDLKGAGLRLRTLRKALGVTRNDIAAKTKITPAVMCQVEQGKGRPASSTSAINAVLELLHADMAMDDYVWNGGSYPASLEARMAALYRFEFLDYECSKNVVYRFAIASDDKTVGRRFKTYRVLSDMVPGEVAENNWLSIDLLVAFEDDQLIGMQRDHVLFTLIRNAGLPTEVVKYLKEGGAIPCWFHMDAVYKGASSFFDYEHDVSVDARLSQFYFATKADLDIAVKRLWTVIESHGVTGDHLRTLCGVEPSVFNKLIDGILSFEVGKSVFDSVVEGIVITPVVVDYLFQGGMIPDAVLKAAKNNGYFQVTDHANGVLVTVGADEPSKAPDRVLLEVAPDSESQLDRIERLVTLLQQHRGELTLEEKPAAALFNLTIPKGATHYEDSEHSHDGALRFYKVTEDNWLYVWGMVHEVNALGWTTPGNWPQPRLIKLP